MRSNGVRHVALSVLLPLVIFTVSCSRGRSDAQVTQQVQAKINADASLANKQISAQSNQGTVTLSGTVETEAERSTAARDAAQVEGVKTVVNNIEVKAPATVAAGLSAGAPPATPAPAPARSAHRKVAPRKAVAGEPSSGSTKKDEGATAAATPATVVIPEGTRIRVRMIDSVDSEKNKAGDRFRASLDEPIVMDDRVAVPKDADVEGHVVEVKTAGHFTGRSELGLALTRLTLGGKSYELQTSEYGQVGASRGTRTAETVGGGAALGAIIGAVAGGGKGAAIGAAAGAGAGTAVQVLTKGQQIRVPSETVLEFRLKSAVTVTPPVVKKPVVQ